MSRCESSCWRRSVRCWPRPAPTESATANGIVAGGDSPYTAVMPLKSRHEVTVEWGDCDPAGIVYYPSYFRWCDQATYRLFLAAGIARDDTRSGQWKEGTPMVAAECSFQRASQHGEKLVIESHVSRFGRSSFTINHVFRDASGHTMAEG